MNKADLQALLAERKILPRAYSLIGGLPSEQYVLEEQDGERWAVYYSERGERSGERVFETEDAACRYLLELLTNDPTTRVG